jgi:hypothetical protein
VRNGLASLAFFASLWTACALAQTPSPASGPPAVVTWDSSILAGKWTYRSFHNNPTLVDDDPNKALALIFAEAVFTFEIPSDTTLKGAIDWPGGGLDLQGVIRPGASGASTTVEIVGKGRSGTGTDGWEYDYRGQLAYRWPNGVAQVQALVGNVIRAKPHNGAPAGYVASFVAVKKP